MSDYDRNTRRHWPGDLVDDTDQLKALIGDVWEVIPDDLADSHGTPAGAVQALVEQRDEARAELALLPDRRNATAIAALAHSEGYAAALSDVDDQITDTVDMTFCERVAELRGWIRGRRAGL